MQKGFTIIEIIIVVGIIGVIAAIAVPSYDKYVVRTNRTAVQTEMVRLSQELQRYQVTNRNSFQGADNKIKGVKNASFPDGTPHYTINIQIQDNGRKWTMTAEPASAKQNGDGSVVLNSRGQKCWTKGSSCTPSSSTDWK
ncbi:type IV pilin protein [Moraxella oblonga]|uniref:type IV pilin protein n=1 Tax=Moraxella oblonga TaxID=200413 RepID=UPI000836B4BC|nr:type IV pilin protein [Moraxella oblonga]